MQIKFKPCPDLLRVGDIGESIVEADDSFRRQFSILVLAAARDGNIPIRNKNGVRIPQESLDITESQTRDFAKHHVEEKLLPPGGDFDADLQRAKGLLSAQPWIQQYCGIEAKLQAYAKEFEKHKQHIETVIQSETTRLLDDWYRDASVLVSEVAEWFCRAHDFEGHMAAPSSPTDEQTRSVSNTTTVGYDQLLAICNVQDEDDFGGYVVKKTGLYVKNHKKHNKHAWSLLTPSEKAVLAWHPTGEYDKPALPLPCPLGQLRSFVVEAGLAGCLDEDAVGQLLTSVVKNGEATLLSSAGEDAATDRFAQRDFDDGFDKVTREKAGERDFEARVAAVNLTDERCIQLAHSYELRIADWTALTGVGCGELQSYLITAKGVAFRNWTEREISEASVDQQIDMHRDNEAQPLQFPCAPVRFMQFIDAAPPGSHNFTVPEAFRRAVLTSERSTNVAAEAIRQVTQDQGCKSSEANPAHEMLAKTPEESGDTGAPASSEVARKNRQEHDIKAERGCRRIILEHWDTIEKLHGPRAKGFQVQRFLRNQPDNRESEASLKTIQNRLIDLRKQKLIP
jgi:hypothetical protein